VTATGGNGGLVDPSSAGDNFTIPASDERLIACLDEWVQAGCPDEFPVGRGEE
jgi:hypothetical protein